MLSADGNYCDVLARESDLGDFLKRFTNNLEFLPKDEYRKMLSYVDPAQIPDPAKRKVVEKLIDRNIEVFKSFLLLVRDFSRPHSRVHKKYKHGGMPIRQPYAIVSRSIDLTGFDAYSIILTENTISKPVTLLPSSPKGTEAYDVLSSKIEKYLMDVVENRIRIMERKIEGMIPLENYDPAALTKNELDLLEEAKKEFDEKHPAKVKEGFFDIAGIATDTELLRWYQRIDDFMMRMKSL